MKPTLITYLSLPRTPFHHKENQTQLEELILLPNYAGEDVTDPTQAPINKTLMLKVKSMHNSFHAFHTVLRLQARLNHLEAVTSFSSPEAKTPLDHFQQEYVKLERRAKKIKADSFLQEWVSLRERYVIVDHRAQDQHQHQTLQYVIPKLTPLMYHCITYLNLTPVT